MPSLEDVKTFARQHADDDTETLEGRIARQFKMNREEAARLVRDLRAESAIQANDVPGEGVPNAAILAAPGAIGTSSAGYTNPAAAPIIAGEMDDQRDKERKRERE